MKIDDIESLLNKAVENLYRNQPNFSVFTSETGQTEWNIAYHLANEIHVLFPDYDCDLDVTKRNFKKQRPDIIIHARGRHDKNFLVIEIKRDGMVKKIDADIRKIKDDWFREPLCYEFGAMVVLYGETQPDVMVFENKD